jgi:predicted Zn-dependent protease
LLRAGRYRSSEYRFLVIHRAEPNAYALPGKKIAVTSGLLALVNNEAELAWVIGHEIVHAERDHQVAMQELEALSFPSDVRWWWIRSNPQAGDYRAMRMKRHLSRMAAYSRDMESEADGEGQRLCIEAGYDAGGMSGLLTALHRYERLRGRVGKRSFLATHPPSLERGAVSWIRVDTLQRQSTGRSDAGRDSLLGQVDGLVLADQATRAREDHRFRHPRYGFQMHFPIGWRRSEDLSSVEARSPDNEAAVFLDASQPYGDAERVAHIWLEKTQAKYIVDLRSSEPVKIGGIDAWVFWLDLLTPRGAFTSHVTFIPYGDTTWRITGVSPSSSDGRQLKRAVETAQSFTPPARGQLESMNAVRLHVLPARTGESLAALSRRTDNVWNLAETAVYNGLSPDHRFGSGELIKIARDEAVEVTRSASLDLAQD